MTNETLLLQALAAVLRIALGAGVPARVRLPVAAKLLVLLLFPLMPAPLRAALCRIPALRRLARRAGLRARLAHHPFGDCLALRRVRDWVLSCCPCLGMRPAATPPAPWPPAGRVRAPPVREGIPSLNTPRTGVAFARP